MLNNTVLKASDLNKSFSGIVATNTTVDKSSLSNLKYKNIEGGLSGEPLMKKSTEIIKMIDSNPRNNPQPPKNKN